jgi:diguanylate cyclase (GGDEF)-like protein
MTIQDRLPTAPLILDGHALDRLMPMHLRLDAQGAIRSVGPTLTKLLPPLGVQGRMVGRVFALRRPTSLTQMADLRARIGTRLHLALRNDPSLVLRGMALPAGDGGLLINLSFGIWVHEAVRRYGLTVADFAATDLTVEMLYLVEAKSAVTEELRNLNLRLNGAKVAAEEQALTDTLTGLRNRRALDSRLVDLATYGQTFGLMHLDLDFFKAVNDTFGHAAGDHVLRKVASILTAETRTTDLVARVGGDEFVMVFPGLADHDRLKQIASRIIEQLTQPITYDGAECRISGSIGITVSTNYDTPDINVMHADADEALYTSKRAGRGRATLIAALFRPPSGQGGDSP